MTGQRDIERVLDAWFVDGPSVMPDRVFDAVLDQVERTDQHLLARLRLRLTDMNPRIRWLTAMASVLVAVLLAMTLIDRPADGDVGATSNPSNAPAQGVESPAGSESASVPSALRFIWLSTPRSDPAVDPEAGVTLQLERAMSTWMTNRPDGLPFTHFSRVEAVDEDTIRMRSSSSAAGCTAGDTGTYTWSLSSSGQTLELEAEEADACAFRSATMAGTYWRADCPTAQNDCLGPLDPGTYASQFFDPFTSRPVRRYGALSYTVPGGWLNHEDWPGFYKLAPVGASPETMIFLASDVVVADDADSCPEIQDPGVGTSAEDIADWLATADGLVASTPAPVSIGGLDGFRVDIAMDPAWTGTCPFSDGARVRHLFTDRPSATGFDWALLEEERMRLYFLDLGEERALMIDIDSLSTAEFDAFIDEATQVVESFVFTR
jgi:hypothetical protein